jgi:hypothetical protein
VGGHDATDFVLVLVSVRCEVGSHDCLRLSGIAHFHPAVLRSPTIEGVLADSQLAAEVADLGTGVVLLERRDDLLPSEAALSHRRMLIGEEGRFRCRRCGREYRERRHWSPAERGGKP